MICVKILALLLLVWLVCVIMLACLMIVMISRVSNRYPRRRPNPTIDDDTEDEAVSEAEHRRKIRSIDAVLNAKSPFDTDDEAISEVEHRRKIRSIDAVLNAELPHDTDVEPSLLHIDNSTDYYKLHYASDSEGFAYS